ncbi:hypothetical protein Bca4012_058550 [Brassica carinata]|uniref:Uncharacterized protein n=1 Tax=Brassica carinata TaxID=52824 RepID=A0A8X7W6R1_BRACI|nr:hypothetical protein Bca52824_016281 [Brassica carinata]
MAHDTCQESAYDDTYRNIQSVRGDSFISGLEPGKLEDHQPPSLLQMELQNIDRFSESSRLQVHQEVVTVRDQLEKKERDPGLLKSERRRSQRFTTKNKIDKLTSEDIGFCFYLHIFS